MTELLVGARRGLHAVGRSHWPTIILFVLLLAACIALLRRDSQTSPLSSWPNGLTPVSSTKPKPPMAQLADLVQKSMRDSRPVLLGSRDPKGASCVKISRSGDVVGTVPDTPGDLNGGPGTTFATIYYFDRQNFKTAHEDYVWHQTRLKTYFENLEVSNRLAGESAHELAEKARQFWEAANSWTQLPGEITSISITAEGDWPSYCLAALDKAVAAKDPAAVKRWSGELASAALSLEDLHRWLGFLVENSLVGLEFQRQCEALFVEADALHKPYDPSATISQFPAGVLFLNGKGNFYEVERQAEQLFAMSSDRVDDVTTEEHLTPDSLWVSPVARKTFLEFQSVLSPDNQKTWAASARQPYQHAYMVNMLFRAENANSDDDLSAVLKKFDELHPHARAGELLAELMYRGHAFGGLEWDDRYRPELMKAANEIKPDATDLEAFEAAWRWTNNFYTAPAVYGVTFTLRDALEQKRLDCVRATDMISSIFRNSGRAGIGNIRWSSATCGHSVAALLEPVDDKIKVSIGDGLTTPREPEVWPDCYFHGHAWPSDLQDNAPPYAGELYVRGLDGYIWAEGYIIRGPTAGTFTSVDIPYSAHHHQQFTKKIFDGPYPQ
jgi:hypothetical protein